MTTIGIYYTCRHVDAWNTMQQQGYLIGDPKYVMFKDEDFQMYAHAYDWMVEQYEERTGISMNGNYPIWCWDQFPEDTLHHYVEAGDTGVVLTVELPDEQVLASEAYYWEVVAMKGSLHDRIEDYDSDIELTLAQKKVNWEKIFDKDWCYAHAIPVREPEYQHVVHRIDLHQVRAVTTFTGRGGWMGRSDETTRLADSLPARNEDIDSNITT